jgi:hypothetical protein
MCYGLHGLSPGDKDPMSTPIQSKRDFSGGVIRFGCGAVLGLALWPIAVGRAFMDSWGSNIFRIVLLMIACGVASLYLGNRFWRAIAGD